MESEESTDWQTALPSKLRLALWKRVDQRLHRGDVLIADEQFLELMQEEFKRLVGIEASPKIRAAMLTMIQRVNAEHPNKYLVFGIKNMMMSYTRTLLDRLGDDSEDALKEGIERIKNMVRERRTVLFLESIGIDLGDKGLPRSIERIIEQVVNSKQLDVPLDELIAKEREKRPTKKRAAKKAAAPLAAKVQPKGDGEGAEELSPLQKVRAADEENRQHEQLMVEREQQIMSEETTRARSYIMAYKQQGILDEEDVQTLEELHSVDDALSAGKIDQQEAEHRRSKVEHRQAVNEKLQQAILFGVHHIHIFEGLRRLPAERDGVLRLLIQHKEIVMADQESDLKPILDGLEHDETLLENAIQMVKRQDHEVRMLLANLTPYRHAISVGKVTFWRIRESFVDDLRSLNSEELSRQLNSADEIQRTRTASSMSCLVELIRQLVKETPLHMHVLRLHIRKTVARLYKSVPQASTGRQKVKSFLTQRVPRLFPDLNSQELDRINKEGDEVMFQIESEREEDSDDGSMRVFRV